MRLPRITHCPSLLIEGFDTYSPAALNRLFDGKKVFHVLDYDAPWINDTDNSKFMDNSKRISISGVQEKYSLIQEKNQLRLTEKGEQGTHILKPMPVHLRRPKELPANEHLTMQIASQVYSIHAAHAAIVFFKNGEAAYLTRRFDRHPDGTRRAKEDFATLAGKSAATGTNFKYDGSYEGIGRLIRQYVPAWRIETEKFFSLVVFNYLFSNGDAHLKNFALLETDKGDHILSPAYDLVNTKLHIDDSDFALDKGLFDDGFRSPSFQQHGHPSQSDFRELSRRLDMASARTERLLTFFSKEHSLVGELVSRSFLSNETKKHYHADYQMRLKHFNAQ
jgi:serine/threonine-protein kinase HipA